MFVQILSRRVPKWIGTILCVLILAASLASIGNRASFSIWNPYHYVQVEISDGVLCFYLNDYLWDPSGEPWVGPWEQRLEYDSFASRHTLGDAFRVPSLSYHSGTYLDVPLGLPSLVCLAFTLALWRFDRRSTFRSHCIKCNYNLTGNTSGRCRECGLQITLTCGSSSPSG